MFSNVKKTLVLQDNFRIVKIKLYSLNNK